MSKQSGTDALLEELRRDLKQYHSVHDAGKEVVDLKSFDQKVRSLCKQVSALPRDRAVILEPALEEIQKSLSQLAEKLSRRKEEIQGQLGNLEYTRKAQVAYKTATSLDTGKKEDKK